MSFREGFQPYPESSKKPEPQIHADFADFADKIICVIHELVRLLTDQCETVVKHQSLVVLTIIKEEEAFHGKN
ncbi:hypothetical protein CEE37_07905 [candidate division LCP-89 bacterium B3_LCP]|uniref:Uncharacterized protein n=1 Tax=candidate division LCP-89 bacterium B3_LCP TaxID=2012998 RepID=A0A532UZ64_UNCL8|nr:MAG: hypothetical protein CEE37_07905 [candidate division LCP-89 bacterium B3_LCP]